MGVKALPRHQGSDMNREFIVQMLLGLIMASVLGGFGFALIRLHVNSGKAILAKWADANGFQLLNLKRAFWVGPFNPLTTGGSRTVFAIKVKDREGHERSGWVRCGTFWGGALFSDK